MWFGARAQTQAHIDIAELWCQMKFNRMQTNFHCPPLLVWLAAWVPQDIMEYSLKCGPEIIQVRLANCLSFFFFSNVFSRFYDFASCNAACNWLKNWIHFLTALQLLEMKNQIARNNVLNATFEKRAKWMIQNVLTFFARIFLWVHPFAKCLFSVAFYRLSSVWSIFSHYSFENAQLIRENILFQFVFIFLSHKNVHLNSTNSQINVANTKN